MNKMRIGVVRRFWFNLRDRGNLKFSQKFIFSVDICLLISFLVRRNLIKGGFFYNFIDLMCVSYFAIEEDLFHLLFFCLFATRVWESICGWLEMKHLVENSILNYVDNLFSFMSGKVVRSKKMLVWLAMCGSLWLRRNNIILNNVGSNIATTFTKLN